MHLLLSFIGDLTDKDIDSTINQTLSKAVWEFPRSIKSRYLKTLITGYIKRKTWKQFFFCPGAEVFQEKEFITSRGQTKRIDRLIVKDSLVLIVDYKSSPDLKEENLLQMREYIALAKEIYLNKAIKGYFLYFDRPDIEEING